MDVTKFVPTPMVLLCVTVTAVSFSQLMEEIVLISMNVQVEQPTVSKSVLTQQVVSGVNVSQVLDPTQIRLLVWVS